MTIRIYSSLDSGAPALPNLSSQRAIDNLKIVLKACLVDGYSGKPAAGWTIGHEHADGISFSNGEGYINFVQVSGNIQVYLMESITNGSAALAQGANRRSGPWYEGQATAARHYCTFPPSGTSAVKGWVVVADDKTVTWLAHSGSAANFAGAEVANNVRQAMHFGRFYPAIGGNGFGVLGGGVSPASSGHYLFRPTAPSGTVLRNPFTGLIDQGSEPQYTNYVAYPQNNPGANTLLFSPRVLQTVRCGLSAGGAFAGGNIASQGTYAGALRGMLYDPAMAAVRANLVLPQLGIASPGPEDMIRSLLVGGKSVVPLWPHTTDGGGFISLDPADWEPLWT